MIVLEGKQLYTVEESAALLGMGARAIQNRIKAGTLKAVIISGVKHVSGDDLKAAAAATRKRKGTGKNGE